MSASYGSLDALVGVSYSAGTNYVGVTLSDFSSSTSHGQVTMTTANPVTTGLSGPGIGTQGDQTVEIMDVNDAFDSGTLAFFQDGTIINELTVYFPAFAQNAVLISLAPPGALIAELNVNINLGLGLFTDSVIPANTTLDVAAAGSFNVACFAEGTRILTERGEVAVEALREGDRVATREGAGATFRPVRWIGRSRIDLDRHKSPRAVQPIRISAGAFGKGLPDRDLLLSPDHAVFVNDVLIPAHLLLNGATVRREAVVGVIRYFHVELDAHAILLANGLPAESYLDTGNRSDFDNGGACVRLHPDFSRRFWDGDACAPLVTAGPALAAARARLRGRAERLGFRPTQDAALRVEAGGRPVAASASARGVRCDIPAGAEEVRLLSRAFVPDEHDRGGDARRLGVALLGLRLDGAPMRPVAGRGFHPAERHAAGWLQWTDGDATLTLAPAARVRRLEIELLPVSWLSRPYWERAGVAGRRYSTVTDLARLRG